MPRRYADGFTRFGAISTRRSFVLRRDFVDAKVVLLRVDLRRASPVRTDVRTFVVQWPRGPAVGGSNSDSDTDRQEGL
jgi:hypothetical protein